MAKRKQTKEERDALQNIEDSAHKIWLAGLGAFSKAEQEGEKLFKSLVKKGAAVEDQYREHLVGSAKKAASKTARTIDFMEDMFEKRISEAVTRVHAPAAESLDAAVKQMRDLRSSILGLMGISAATPATAKKKTVAKKAAKKKIPKKKVAKKKPRARKTTKKAKTRT